MTIDELEIEQAATRDRQQSFCGSTGFVNYRGSPHSTDKSHMCRTNVHDNCIWQGCNCECHSADRVGAC